MDDVWRQELSGLAEKNRRRHLLSLTPLPYGRLRLPDGRELLNLCGNDFLDLALDPRVREAARRALDETGAGAGASRLVTGNLPLHEQAEAAVAELVDQPAALPMPPGAPFVPRADFLYRAWTPDALRRALVHLL